MQESARQQILAGLLEGLALQVLRTHGDAFSAPHLLAKARDAEAAVLAYLLALDMQDRGIEEHQFVGRIFAVRSVDDRDLLRYADLRRREAHSLGGVHGFEHVLDEFVQVRRVELRDRFGLTLQHWVAVFYD